MFNRSGLKHCPQIRSLKREGSKDVAAADVGRWIVTSNVANFPSTLIMSGKDKSQVSVL